MIYIKKINQSKTNQSFYILEIYKWLKFTKSQKKMKHIMHMADMKIFHKN